MKNDIKKKLARKITQGDNGKVMNPKNQKRVLYGIAPTELSISKK